MSLPTLYHKDSKGNLRSWRVWVQGEWVLSEAGLVDGAKIGSSYKCEATNVGRSNERTPEQQAVFQAASDWNNKVERKYRPSPEEAEAPLSEMPMLAQTYKAKKHLGPFYVQPKLDGVRALSFWNDDYTRVRMVSRSGQEWDFPEICAVLEKVLPPGHAVDGEIYKHGEKLQKISSLARGDHAESSTLEYYLYDMPVVSGNTDLPQFRRLQHLKEFFQSIQRIPESALLALTPTTDDPVSAETAFEMEQLFVQQGFEGAIGRTVNGQYRYAARSHDLVKFKSFDDTEFQVIGATEGIGKDAGTVIFICRNDINDKEFKVRPAATHEARKEMWENKNKYIGRMYTVKHKANDRTNDGLRSCMTGKCFRHMKDLDK